MKRRNLAVAIVLILALGSIGAYAAYPRIASTSISRINAEPKSFDGKEVNVFGTIIDRGENEFVLADGTGTIKVQWAGTLPAVGTSKVLVHGFVRGRVIQVGDIFRFEDVRLVATSLDIWPI